MSTVRAKFECSGVTKRLASVWHPGTRANREVYVYDAELCVVTDADSSAIFFFATPNESINIQTMRDDLFDPGRTYYVDFSIAPAFLSGAAQVGAEVS